MNDKLISKIYIRTIIASLFIIGFSFFIFKEAKFIILGFIFGVIINMLSFKLIDKTVKKSVKMTPSKANSYTVRHHLLRYVIYFIVLSIAALADYLNFASTALGLLMIKFVIVISAIFDKDFLKK